MFIEKINLYMVSEPKITKEIVVRAYQQVTVNFQSIIATGTVKFIDGKYYDTYLRSEASMGLNGKFTPSFLRELADVIEKGA